MSKQTPSEVKRAAAFAALVDSVSIAPLAHIPVAGFLYADDEGMAYSERRPDVEPMVAVYTFDALQQAFAVGRALTRVDAHDRQKAERRGYHEYQSWAKSIPADRKRRRQADGEAWEQAMRAVEAKHQREIEEIQRDAENRILNRKFDPMNKDQSSGVEGGDEAEPCPRGKLQQPEPSCTDRNQCWEPCGKLGNDAKHVRVASEKDTAAINKALGVALPDGGQKG